MVQNSVGMRGSRMQSLTRVSASSKIHTVYHAHLPHPHMRASRELQHVGRARAPDERVARGHVRAQQLLHISVSRPIDAQLQSSRTAPHTTYNSSIQDRHPRTLKARQGEP